MKKNIVLFISIIALAFTLNSCSNDDDVSGSNSGRILGKWIPLKHISKSPGGSEEVIMHQHLCSTTKDYYMFNEGGNLLAIDYLTCSSSNQYNVNWSINGNFIIFRGIAGDEYVERAAKILELSSSKLRYNFYYNNDNNAYDIYEFVRE
jgi:hypothetical protein